MTKKSRLSMIYSLSLVILFGLILTLVTIPERIFISTWLPILFAAASIFMIFVSRALARKASREAAVDSILVFRIFFLVFWVLWLVLPYAFSEAATTENYTVAGFLVVIIIANIIGLYIHLRSRSKFVKNIKKDELFQ